MTQTSGHARWIRTCSAVALSAGCACGPALARQSAAWGEYSFSNIDNLSGPVVKISGGAFHVLVLKGDGTVAAWGKGIYGECNVPPGLRNVVDVSAGYWHSAALRSDGTIEVWGATDLTDLTPKNMPLLSAMDCGRYFMLAVRTDGTVFGWGEDQMGQLDVPPGLTGVMKVAGGTNHSAAVRADGTVVAWGSNSSGQCNVPSDLGPVVAIDANSTSTVVLQSNGVARCWGAANSAGEPNVVGIAAQGGGLAMLRADGTIARFGSLPAITGAYTALQPAAVLGVGGGFYVAMRTDGMLVGRAALANNLYGAATPPPQLGQIRSMAADADSAVRAFATADGRLARWETRGDSASPTVRVVKDVGALLLDLQIGRKIYGRQLNGTWRCFDGDMLDEVALSPELSSALAVSTGPWHTLVLRADRTVVCVDAQSASSFTTVPPSLGLANDVSACDQGSAAILQDGSVAYWGIYEDVRGDMPP
ncbi:MAG: hypothetical protein JNK53_08135, partial [Phycisphaerae bacterium]|nr:hypothetical protein [Phycisphaerae bacterium]